MPTPAGGEEAWCRKEGAREEALIERSEILHIEGEKLVI